MTKSELLSTYTAEQLTGMVIDLQSASEVKNDEIHKLKWQISSLEEENGRLQSKLDTYNNYLLPRCTKEARRMIDENRFAEVMIATWDEWNNRRKADRKVCFPKEYEQTAKEFLNIDTSEIQYDCHRFGIESLQRYLKNPAPIKIPKRDDKNMSISDIQKCQEEYEKVLKESPLEGVMDKITKDINEQKNNAMAMEFTRIICDLLKRYGVYVHCIETKFGEKITANSIEEQYGVVFDSMDFSQRDKEFTDKIEELKKENDELKTENAELHCEMQAMSMFPDEFPTEPIKIADMLISATYTRQKSTLEKTFSKAVFGNNSDTLTENVYSKPELRQIAEHLLVYCGHNVEDGNETE